jgi:chemotaxis signal transduction protein
MSASASGTWYGFAAAGLQLAFGPEQASQLLRKPRLSLWPGSPPALAGLTQLRGRAVPVFRLQPLLQQPDANASDEAHFVLVLGEAEAQAGLIVGGLPQPLPEDAAFSNTAAQVDAGELDPALQPFLVQRCGSGAQLWHALDWQALFHALGRHT